MKYKMKTVDFFVILLFLFLLIPINGWVNNPQHRENIEGNYNLIGVSVAKDGNKYYITQIFVNSN
jgi:hypothetical protein